MSGIRTPAVSLHFNLIERLHMLHGFSNTLADLYLEPRKIERVLDMILAFKLELFDELHRRYGDRVHGLFLTDDWGTQKGAFISPQMFRAFFLDRYRTLAEAIRTLSLQSHYSTSFLIGVIRFEDVVFFIGLIVVMLFVTTRLVESRRWR